MTVNTTVFNKIYQNAALFSYKIIIFIQENILTEQKKGLTSTISRLGFNLVAEEQWPKFSLLSYEADQLQIQFPILPRQCHSPSGKKSNY